MKNTISLLVLAGFVLLALGSGDSPPVVKSEYLGEGIYKVSTTYFYKVPSNFGGAAQVIQSEVITGAYNEYGEWSGPVNVKHSKNGDPVTGQLIEEETVNMVNGERHGKSVRTNVKTGQVTESCFDMGKPVPCTNLHEPEIRGLTAFDYLLEAHPSFLSRYDSSEYLAGFTSGYLDALQDQLATYTFPPEEFNNYYGDAVSDLSDEGTWETTEVFLGDARVPWEVQAGKRFEYRKAQVERYWGGNGGSHDIVLAYYPHLAEEFAFLGVEAPELEAFFNDFDARLDQKKGNMSTEDPYFLDSLDQWIYQVMDAYLDTGLSPEDDPENQVRNALYRLPIRDIGAVLHTGISVLRNSFEFEAEVLAYLFLARLQEADPILNAVKKAWFVDNEVIRPPVLVTQSMGATAADNATIRGHLIEDGGTVIQERGIVWDTVFLPDVNTHKMASGTGIGEFTVTLTGLQPGKRYFARSYALHTDGPTYGNTVSFTAGEPSSIQGFGPVYLDLRLAPNPATAEVRLQWEGTEGMPYDISLWDLQGRKVLAVTGRGTERVLGLEGIRQGVYVVTVRQQERKFSARLVID
ncbi:MAG: T9SS type A sorting domain-containing protein [Saprospiraceae bacterium]|nr:T9SS type A sorting domain-containing protein [Saprospiraceae bacterium]